MHMRRHGHSGRRVDLMITICIVVVKYEITPDPVLSWCPVQL